MPSNKKDHQFADSLIITLFVLLFVYLFADAPWEAMQYQRRSAPVIDINSGSYDGNAVKYLMESRKITFDEAMKIYLRKP